MSTTATPIRDGGTVDHWRIDIEKVGRAGAAKLLVRINRNGRELAAKEYAAGTPLGRAFTDLALAILAGVIPEEG